MAPHKAPTLKGLERFQQALMDEGLPEMVRWFRSKRKSKLLLNEIHKQIFELGPPTPPGKRTGRSNHHQLLMYHCSEIQTTLETMKDIEFYVGRFPYRKEKVDKHRHLQFHVEAFLHELYILQQRLIQFLKFIERQHRRDPRLPRIQAACKMLNAFVIDSMRIGISIRSSHVHKWRLSDTQFDRLGGIKLYTMMPNEEIRTAFKAYYESEYKKIRGRWCTWIAGGMEEAQKLVDAYFDQLFKLLADDKGKLVYPSRLKF